jgi:protein TonB
MIDSTRSPTANDRLKDRSGDVVAFSLIAAVIVHVLVFQLWPEMSVTVWTDDGDGPLDVLVMPDEIPIPVPPEPIVRPATPRISADAPDEATIDHVSFERAAELPAPPPPPAERAEEGRSAFEVFDVAPRLVNPGDFQRALERAYPDALRDAGIGGTVTLQVYIDAEGRALEGRVVGESGYHALDAAALELIDVMRFSPALNRDRAVPVWVQLPIAFRVREDARAG